MLLKVTEQSVRRVAEPSPDGSVALTRLGLARLDLNEITYSLHSRRVTSIELQRNLLFFFFGW